MSQPDYRTRLLARYVSTHTSVSGALAGLERRKPYLDRLAEMVPGHIAVTGFPRLKTICHVDARLRLLDQFPGFVQVLSLANPPIELIAPPERSPGAAAYLDWLRNAQPAVG